MNTFSCVLIILIPFIFIICKNSFKGFKDGTYKKIQKNFKSLKRGDYIYQRTVSLEYLFSKFTVFINDTGETIYFFDNDMGVFLDNIIFNGSNSDFWFNPVLYFWYKKYIKWFKRHEKQYFRYVERIDLLNNIIGNLRGQKKPINKTFIKF